MKLHMHTHCLLTGLAVSGLLAGPLSLNGAPDTVDTDFANTAGTVYRDNTGDFGSVASLLMQPDGKILVGSNEMATTLAASPSGLIQAPLIRLNPDGTVDNTFFADANEVGEDEGIVFIGQGWPEVMALGLQSDGKIIAGGVMTGMNDGTNNVISRNIVRINPDGSVDPSFQTAGTQQWLSGGINYINHLIVAPDDKVVVAGGFRGVRNANDDPFMTRHGIARLNADGSLDTGFALDLTQFGVNPGLVGSARVIVYQIERDAGGNYYIVGEISGTGPNIQIFARLFPNGSRDFSFAPDLPEARWNSVALDRQGRITVTGLVTSNPTVMYRVFADGSLDSTFTAPGGLFGVMAQPLQIDSAGRFLYTAGNQLRRILPDGSIDPTFTGTADWAVWATTPSWNVATTAPDGRIYAGGFFNRVNGEEPVKFVRFEGNPVANAFVLDATSVSVVENAGTLYLSVSRLGDGSGAASVDYTTANGTALPGTDFAATSGTLTWADGETGPKFFAIALIDNAVADGDKTFSVNFSGASGAPIDGPTITAITILDDEAVPVITTQPASQSVKQGNNATLSVGVSAPVPVSFQWFKDGVIIPGATSRTLLLVNANEGTAADYTVEVTGNGDPVLSDPATITVISAESLLDPAYAPTGISSALSAVLLPGGDLLTITGNSTDGFTLVRYDADGVPVATQAITYSLTGTYSFPGFGLHPAPDGTFLLSGNFGVINGVAQPRLVRFNADLTIDFSFNANIGTGNVPVSGVTVTSSGAIYLSIRLQSPWLGLARLLHDGSVDPTFSSTLTNSSFGFLDAVYELPDGGLLVGHNSGPGNNTFGLAKLSPDGSPFPGFNANSSLSPRPQHFLHLPDGRFYVARNTILERRLANGDLDPTFDLGGGFSGNITGIHFQRGRIVVTGPVSFAGEPIPGLARFSLDGAFDDNFPGGTGPNTGFGTQVSQALIDSTGSLIVRGGFSTWAGVARAGIARLLLTGNEVGFSTFSATAFENEGTLKVEVVRYGDTSGAASVRVTSVDGSATSPDNFVAVDEIVTWEPGDAAPKVVTITLVNDDLVNGDRSFTLELSEATNLTAIATPFTITLRDDDSLPQITSQPQDVDVPPGFAASFTVAIASPTAETYQWFKDGVAIASATTATYTIASAAAANEGVYTVRITNTYDSVLSGPATLTIVPPPAAIADVFTGTPAFAGNILALANAPDGGVYVGGQFTNYDSTSRNYLVKINEDGTLDTGFNPPVLNGFVRHITVQADGKLLIAGDFSQVNGNLRNRGLLRLEADGTEDSVFSANTGSGGNGNGYATDILPDGRIVFGGTFTSWNGTSLGSNRYLIRLNTDGTFDGAYAEPSTNHILALRALPDGSVLASNNTTSSSAVKVSRFLPDRSRDATFLYASGRNRVDAIALDADGNYLFAGPGSTVRTTPNQSTTEFLGSGPQFALQVQINGKLLLGGSSGARLSRLLPDGSADPFFVLSANPNGNVNALALRPDGKFWAGGAFTTINGRTVNRLVLLNGDVVKLAITVQPATLTIVDPGEDITLRVDATGNTAISYQWFKDGEPLNDGADLSGATTNTLVIASAVAANSGSYTVVATNESGSETSITAQVVVLDAPVFLSQPEGTTVLEGATVTLSAEVLGASPLTFTWRRSGVLVEDGLGVSGATTPALVLTGVSTADSGDYVLTVSNPPGFVSSTPAFVDVIENPAAIAPGFNALNFLFGRPSALLPLPDGRLLIGGNFTGVSDGTHTSGARLAVINPDGTVEPVPGLGADNTVLAIRPASGGKFLLAGQFNTINGETRRRVARLNADFSLDTTFDASAGFANFAGAAHDVAEENGGTLLVGGWFSDFGGQPGTAYIVRLNASGSHDPSFNSAATNAVYRILPQPDGGAIMGGFFSNWGGRDWLVRTLADGSAHPSISSDTTGAAFALSLLDLGEDGILASFSSGGVRLYAADGTRETTLLPTDNPHANALARDVEGRFYLGGGFTSIGGQPRNRIARILTDNSVDPAFGLGSAFDNTVELITLATDGSVWVSGMFFLYDGIQMPRLVRLKGDSVGTGGPVEPTPAEAFAAYLAAAGVPEGLRGPADDADGDGIPNLVEWVYDLNPNESDAGFKPLSALLPADGASLNALNGGSEFDPAERYLTFVILLAR
ncbi:MAG: immunoglobulin domain-containing protein [Opitutales bacterium]|nr:immunoglobulin domain-containing protein [Opitutales bacterium]